MTKHTGVAVGAESDIDVTDGNPVILDATRPAHKLEKTMLALLGLLLLGCEPAALTAGEKPESEFKIEVHIVEFKLIEGVTKKTSDPEIHLHIKPALVVTKADVVSATKRQVRGPTIGTRKTGFKHYPGLQVDIQLTAEAKQRLKAAVLKARATTTSKTPVVGIVINGKYTGVWTKFFLDDPSLSPSYWKNFGLRIGCTFDKEKADRIVKHFTPSKKKAVIKSTEAAGIDETTTCSI